MGKRVTFRPKMLSKQRTFSGNLSNRMGREKTPNPASIDLQINAVLPSVKSQGRLEEEHFHLCFFFP